MNDMISRDKAIAALSEINKLRHEWYDVMSKSDVTSSSEYWRGVTHCRIDLTARLERAYEILNSD